MVLHVGMHEKFVVDTDHPVSLHGYRMAVPQRERLHSVLIRYPCSLVAGMCERDNENNASLYMHVAYSCAYLQMRY